MAAAQGPLRVGVLGCADIAWRRTLPALAACPDTELAAVASRDEAKGKRFAAAFGAPRVQGYEELLAARDIDAVYLPLPAMMHAHWVAKALRAGKHVLAEKPLTGDAKSTDELLALADSQGLVLLENVVFPHHSQHARVRRMLADGAVGELKDFTGVFTIPPLPDENMRYDPDIGGGALLDMGVYPIRAALYYLGPALDVLHAVLRIRSRTGAVISGRILACTPGGVTADLAFGMEHSYRTGCAFAGSSGLMLLDRAFTPPPPLQPLLRVERQDHREEITFPADDQFGNIVRHFAHAALTGSSVHDQSEMSRRQARIIDDVRRVAVRIEVP
ncbi:Gfo/Idh/MocA family oxidoreductase [Streptomyces monashensis]|uniref:Gfo/Idh/MocA family protein n=1 Tax=Streptomyces monashensis TaxID=1678012 RepID=UPI0033C36F85